MWDNAYVVHDLYDESDKLLNIFDEAKRFGTEDRVYCFASSSKITLPGAGVAVMAASKSNIAHTASIMAVQTIGHDKINQLRHLRFLPDKAAVRTVMQKHAALLRPKFECLLKMLKEELGGLGIAGWTNPRGGYFVSLNVMDGCAKRVYTLCKEAGITLTGVGATYPYGKDPYDRNLRLAPTYPTLTELQAATAVLTCAVRLAASEKLLGLSK